MAKADYTYAVARIRSMELKLFSAKEIENLLSLSDYNSCLRYLNEKGWGDDNSSLNGDEIISIERKKIWKLMNELVKEENTFDVFLIQNDFHNLKVAIKSITRNVDPENMFIEFGKISGQKIYESIQNRKYSYLPEYLQNIAKYALDTLLQTSDGQLCDVLIDKACLDAVYKIGQSSDNEIIKLYSELFVASSNIKTAVRCAKVGKTLNFIKQALAECNSINCNALAVASSKGLEEVCN